MKQGVNRTELDATTIRRLAIAWHPTTPRSFECQPGCVCCCVATFFFPSEAETCPVEVQDALTLRQGLIQPQRRPPGVCVFFDENESRHCRIFAYRPLHCRLYPYLPLITYEGIVIVADPLCTVTFPETDFPEWYRCYGLGCGQNVERQVEEMGREFLEKVVNEYPQLLAHLCVSDVEKYINRKEVEKSLHPLYPKWDTETIRRAAAVSERSGDVANMENDYDG